MISEGHQSRGISYSKLIIKKIATILLSMLGRELIEQPSYRYFALIASNALFDRPIFKVLFDKLTDSPCKMAGYVILLL